MERVCPTCQAAMFQAQANVPFQPGGKLTAIKEPVKAFGRNVSSTLSVFMCSGCGYAELYADDPQRFATDQE